MVTNNHNQFYEYTGADNKLQLPTFRVDSPMKGRYSSKDQWLLSFIVVSIDTVNMQMTARECFWARNSGQVEWGTSKTIDLRSGGYAQSKLLPVLPAENLNFMVASDMGRNRNVVSAILTIVIGVVHEAMTFHSMIAEGFTGLDTAWRQTFTYFSLGCGGLLILCGLLFWMLVRSVEGHEFPVAPLVAIGSFALVDGILSVCYMFDNPFGWVVLLPGLGLFITSMTIRSKRR